MRLICVTFCFALSACNGAPLFTHEGSVGDGGVSDAGDAGDGGMPMSGGYLLTVTPTSDDCSPLVNLPAPTSATVLTGPEVHGLRATWSGPSFGAGGLGFAEVFTLAPDALEMEQNVNGATVTSTFILESVDANGFSVAETQAWTHVADVAAPSQYTPSADCSYAATLRYDLQIPCAEPCELTETNGPGSDYCRCAQ